MRRIALFAAAAVAITAPALAHHGWSSYDETKPITLNGSLTSVSWTNPHGTATTRWQGRQWDVILAPVSRMTSRGLSEAEIAPGQRISITGYARRDGAAEMRIERVMVGNKTVELR